MPARKRRTCGRLGCVARAAWDIVPQYGPSVPRCDDHADEVLAVYSKFDNRNMAGSFMRKAAR